MKTIGFLISHKNGEGRRALLPEHIGKIKNADKLYFETGYGTAVGVSDEEYAACGCHIVPREQALACDIITDVKLGDADYLDEINSSKIMFGWAHTVQNIDFTSDMIRKKHTVVAWEEIFEHGRYIFYRNREVAGEAAVMQAFRYCGKMPYDTRVAILGNGQTAKGAMRILHGLGARVDVYSHRLEQLFRKTAGYIYYLLADLTLCLLLCKGCLILCLADNSARTLTRLGDYLAAARLSRACCIANDSGCLRIRITELILPLHAALLGDAGGIARIRILLFYCGAALGKHLFDRLIEEFLQHEKEDYQIAQRNDYLPYVYRYDLKRLGLHNFCHDRCRSSGRFLSQVLRGGNRK